MKFTIVIPTYKRDKKLRRCIDSILKQTHQDFDIYIVFDNNDEETYISIMDEYYENNKISVTLMEEQLFSPGIWNWYTRNHFDKIQDGILWLCDDTELYPDCLEKLSEFYEKHFPNKDGVVGLHQEVPGFPNATPTQYGQCVLGKEYIKQFPNYEVCCPDYTFWYQDQENYLYAKSIGKFEFCEDARIKHYHPCRIKSEKDETHTLSRGEVKRNDDVIYKKRQEQRLIWGQTWERINE